MADTVTITELITNLSVVSGGTTVAVTSPTETITVVSQATGAVGGGDGTVTSVAMTVPGGFAVSGSPITGSGTLAITGNLATGIVKYTSTSGNFSNAVSGTDYPPAITGAASTIATTDLTANRALISNGDNKVAVSDTISTTELGYLNNVSSNIQTQFTGKQPLDTGLTSIAGLTTLANKMIYTSGSDAYAVTGLTAYGRSIIDVANEAALKALVNLEPGTDVQAYDADLAAIAGLTSAADKGIQFTGSGAAATYDLTAAGKALLDDANATAQRTTLGLGAFSTVATITDAYSGHIETVPDTSASSKTYYIDVKCPSARTLTGLYAQTESGSCTLTLNTATGATSSITANSTGASGSISASHDDVSVDETITLVASSNSSALNLRFTIKYTQAP